MFVTFSRLKPAVRTALLVAMVLFVAGCQAIYRNHGYVPTPEDLAQIKVGVDTRTTVAETIGAPSSTGLLDESGFYYVASRIRHYGARKPQVVERTLVAISFDNSGIVRNIEQFGIENGKVVAFDRRVTSSSVQNKTFFRQLLGNLGNLNAGNFLQ